MLGFKSAYCTLTRFYVLMHADSDRDIPGHTFVVDPKNQFRHLSKFGKDFLDQFQCSQTNSEVLKGKLTFSSNGLLFG